jgi:hypothetical protein
LVLFSTAKVEVEVEILVIFSATEVPAAGFWTIQKREELISSDSRC